MKGEGGKEGVQEVKVADRDEGMQGGSGGRDVGRGRQAGWPAGEH